MEIQASTLNPLSFTLASTNTVSTVSAINTGTGASGNITIGGAGSTNITLTTIYSYNKGAGNAGNVTITSGGSITNTNIIADNIGTGNSGGVSLTAASSISAGTIDAHVVTSTATAGNISLTASGGSITATGSLIAGGSTNGNAGNTILDSSTASFSLASLYNNSDTGAYTTANSPGSGTPGTVTFKQSGTVLPNPTITFATSSNILLDGKSSATLSPLTFTLASTNTLGTVSVMNTGSGASGNITIAGAGTNDVNLGTIYTSNKGTGNAGSVTVASGGSITTGSIAAIVSLSGTTAGNISLTASGGSITASGLATAGAFNGNAGNITLDSSTATFSLSSLSADSATGGNYSLPFFGGGSGTAGSIVFKQSGTVLPNPTVTFANNSNVMEDGQSAGALNPISFVLTNSNTMSATAINTGSGAGGNITIAGTGTNDVNVGSLLAQSSGGNGGTVTVTSGGNISAGNIYSSTGTAGATAGNVNLTATGSITTLSVVSGGSNNGNAGTIKLDSGTASFSVSSLYVNSASGDLFTTNTPGTGTAGSIIFKQSGTVLSNPTVTFAANITILQDGSSASALNPLTFTLASTNTISNISAINSGSGAGGNITITGSGNNDVNLSEVYAYNSGTGNGGNVTVTSGGAINAADINAGGSSSGTGGNISLTTTGSGNISPTGTLTGGAVTLLTSGSGTIASLTVATPAITFNTSGSVTITNSVALTSNGPSSASSISLTDTASGGMSLTSSMSANGTSGGTINLLSAGTTAIGASATIAADGTAGGGGLIQFANSTTNGNVTVVNNGTVKATNTANTSGIVGFNGGTTGSVTLSGSGSVFGGNYVGFGTLNPVTLVVSNPGYPPTTNSFSSGNISVVQGSNILNQIQVTGYTPPVPPAPSPSSASTTLAATTSLNPLALALAAQAAQQAASAATVAEAIGTKIATDVTPYGERPNSTQSGLDSKMLTGGVAMTGAPPSRGYGLRTASIVTANYFTASNLPANISLAAGTNKNFINIERGSAIFMPAKSGVVVGTHEGTLSVGKHTQVMVTETGHDVAIFNLHDRNTGSVKIIVGNKSVSITAGQELVLTRDTKKSFDELNPEPTIAYRQVREFKLPGGVRAFLADFSLFSALMEVDSLKSLLASKNPFDSKHKQGDWILKNAAILADLQAAAGPYHQSTR